MDTIHTIAFPIHVAYMLHTCNVLHRKRTIVKRCNLLKSLMNFVIDIDFELCYNVITMNETKPEGRKKNGIRNTGQIDS